MAEPSRHSPSRPKPKSKSKPRVDMRTLSLTQLQRLAQQGSRRAQAELQARLDAPPPSPVDHRLAAGAAPKTARPPLASAAPRSAASPAAARAPVAPVQLPPLDLDWTATARGARVAPPAMPLPASLQEAEARLGQMAAQSNPDVPPPPADPVADPRVQSYEMLAQHDTAETRYAALPRLIGMVIIAWGVVMLIGGLIFLAKKGGAYYPVMGAATIVVGWQLWRHSFWAMYAQPLVLVLAFGWGWYASGKGGDALFQSAPFLLPATWMFFGAVRERLE
ncbi:MAG: hypothetical protein LBP52_01205 [Burkholderiaceae bacterium]|nr:hypothetical protein [Burkholderiaceae bacterium]